MKTKLTNWTTRIAKKLGFVRGAELDAEREARLDDINRLSDQLVAARRSLHHAQNNLASMTQAHTGSTREIGRRLAYLAQKKGTLV